MTSVLVMLRHSWRHAAAAVLLFLVAWHGYTAYSLVHHLEDKLSTAVVQSTPEMDAAMRNGDIVSLRNAVGRLAADGVAYICFRPAEGWKGVALAPLAIGMPRRAWLLLREREIPARFNGADLGRVGYQIDLGRLNVTAARENAALYVAVSAFMFLISVLANVGTLRTLSRIERRLGEFAARERRASSIELKAFIDAEATKGAADPVSRSLVALLRSHAEAVEKAGRFEQELAAARATTALASQVAHDIRSPLAALRIALGDLGGLAEDRARIAGTALGRIAAIADELLERYRFSRTFEGLRPYLSAQALTPAPLESLIVPLLAEKRTQYSKRPGVKLEWKPASRRFCSARVQPSEFSRLVSNLINNAAEAVGESGLVRIELRDAKDVVVLTIYDDGKGIPAEVLTKLKKPGATHGKSDGFGLGLSHAAAAAESWGGRLEIESEVGKGTTIRLILPRAEPPAWFCPELILRPSQTAVVLDDEGSIHALWDKRLAESGAEVLHARTPEEFRALAVPPDALYLLDHQLAGRPETGLTLAQERGIAARAILVTGRHDDPALQAECLRLGIRIVPKELAAYVPIRIAAPAGAPDAVLIDDDPLVRATWSLAAKRAGKSLAAYSDAASFIRDADGLPKHVPIYVDSRLGDGFKGEDAALDLSRRGFTELHLETGHDPASFPPLAHIRSVRGKEPPWPAD